LGSWMAAAAEVSRAHGATNLGLVCVLRRLAEAKAEAIREVAALKSEGDAREGVAEVDRLRSQLGVHVGALETCFRGVEEGGCGLGAGTGSAWEEEAARRDEVRERLVGELEDMVRRARERQARLVAASENAAAELGVGDGRGFREAYGDRGAMGPGSEGPGPPVLRRLAESVEAMEALAEKMDDEGRRAFAEVQGMAQRFGQERDRFHKAVLAEAAKCSGEVEAVMQELAEQRELLWRRMEAEDLLDKLKHLQEDVRAANKATKQATRTLEDLVDEEGLDDGNIEVDRAQERLRRVEARRDSLARQSEGLVGEILRLASREGRGPELGDAGAQDDPCVPEWDFPDLPFRAQRLVAIRRPAFASAAAAGAAPGPRERSRMDVEALLRRDGLLIESRSFADYSDENLPPVMEQATRGKSNVLGRRLRGVSGNAGLVILKEIPIAEYQTVKRAVVTAHRLKHPGVVPVECCFVDAARDVVVLHSRFYMGGNMRQWAAGRSGEALLAACLKVAEAVAVLHSNGTLHRDIKPENIVFSHAGDEAQPALCDFDLSLDVSSETRTLATGTFMRGTVLYMPPDAAEGPSPERDIFALGVTFLDMLWCQGDSAALSARASAPGGQLDVGAAQKILMEAESGGGDTHSGGWRGPLSALIRRMIAPRQADRPRAAEVEAALAELVESLSLRQCVACMETLSLDGGLVCDVKDGECAHFVCDECLSADVLLRQTALLTPANTAIRCCVPGCSSAAFDLHRVVKHVSKDSFQALLSRLDDLQRSEMELEVHRRVSEAEASMLRKSKLEIEVLVARKHIEEEIMTTRCPRCRKAFYDYDGCAALVCSECRCGFCALCQENCGSDAHAHLSHCKLNPSGGMHVAEAEFKRVIRDERVRKLPEYLATLGEQVREEVEGDPSVRTILSDLGLIARQGARSGPSGPRHTAEVARLRGLFPDMGERELRAALELAGGDLDAAAGHLLAEQR